MLSKAALLLRPRTLCRTVRPLQAFLSSASHVPSSDTTEETRPNGPISLYNGSQAFQIRIMLGTAMLNLSWWSYFMIDWFIYKDAVSAGGTSLVTSPWFGAAGAVGTVAILFVTRMYARNAVAQVWESEDGQRLGFRMHNMLGNPGRRFEVPIGNARFSNLKVSSFTKDMVALKIDGIPNNCVLDKDGDFTDPDRLRALLQAEKVSITDSKEHRKTWRKTAARASHKR